MVIVDFWATYCRPLQEVVPKYQALVDRFGGTVVASVSLDAPEDVSTEQLTAFGRTRRG